MVYRPYAPTGAGRIDDDDDDDDDRYTVDGPITRVAYVYCISRLTALLKHVSHYILIGFLNLYKKNVSTTGLKMHMIGMCQGTVTGVHQFHCGSVMIMKRYDCL